MLGDAVVGRETELAVVDDFLARMRTESAALALEGEAGIGKTTLLREARRRAESAGSRVLACRPSAAEAKFSFSGLADLLSPVGDETFAALPDPQRDALQVALLRASPKQRPPLAQAVAAGFLGLIRDLARERPLLLAIDDVQWLDAPSLGALAFAARRLELENVGLLYSLRAPSADTALAEAVGDARLQRALLGPFSLGALGRIITDRIDQSLPRPVLVRIVQTCSGNPFYALEIARLVKERGADRPLWSELPVPDDLKALTASRLQALPQASRDALQLASVLAEPDGEAVDLDALASAEDAGIVTVDDRGRIRFVHPLFASAVYNSVATSHRRGLHRRAAEIVGDPEQRARHLALAGQGPDEGVAQRLEDAAALAALRGAPDSAAELMALGARWTPAAEVDGLARRLLGAARFSLGAGDIRSAEEFTDQALQRSLPDPLRARALQLSAQVHGRRSNFGDAAELARAALDLAGEDKPLRATIELDLAFCLASMGEFEAAETHARAALSDAEASEETAVLADALAVLAMAGFLRGRGMPADGLKQALALEDPLGPGAFIMRPSYINGLLQLWTGDLRGAYETLDALHAEVVERGQDGFVPLLSLYLVWVSLWRGELSDAIRFAHEARDAAASLEDPTATAIALGAAALVDAYAGQLDRAREEAQQALGIFMGLQWRSGAIWPLWALGLVELSEENPAGVDGVLGPLAEQIVAMGAGDPVLAVFLPDEVEALVALGEQGRAQLLLEPFARRARELERWWAIAAAARCEGAIEAAAGHPERAFEAFDEALDAHDRAGMPFERARTLLLYGQARRRYKQRGLARELLGEALTLFESIGTPVWAARARAELERAGGAQPSESALTRTERRVAELAAAGLSNREVAQRAFVSVKTVEANLTRVYRKLGVRSRVGLVEALREE